MRTIILFLLLVNVLFGQRVFTERDTAATCNATQAVACSGGTAAATTNSALVETGGTAGSVEDSVQITDNAQRVVYWFESVGPSDTSWNAGTWTVRVNITTTDADGQWDHTHICRVNSSCGSPTAVGSLTDQNIAISTSGTKTMNVTGSSQTAASTDLFLIVLTFQDTAAHGNMSAGITPSLNIDTPLTALASRRRSLVSTTGN